MSQKEKYRVLSSKLSLPLFFQPWWLDVVSSSWDVAMVEEHGAVTAVWPYNLDRKMGLTILRQPLLTPYLGPVFFLPAKEKPFGRWNQEDKLYKELWKQLPPWDFFEVECLPGYNNFLPFHHNGFAHSQRLTYILDLTPSEEELFAKMKSSQRSHIKQAAQELTIQNSEVSVDEFYSLYQNTFQRKGKQHFVSKKLFHKIITASANNSAGLLLSAKYADDTTAATIFACYDAECMYLLLSAVNAGKIHTGAVPMLIWEAIKKAKAFGLKKFDFEGSMDAGIEGFFRSFGGQRVPYLICTSYRSRVWKWKRALLG